MAGGGEWRPPLVLGFQYSKLHSAGLRSRANPVMLGCAALPGPPSVTQLALGSDADQSRRRAGSSHWTGSTAALGWFVPASPDRPNSA